jgi:CRP/FNR family transcriptional regulator
MNKKNNLLQCPNPQTECKKCPIRKMALFRDVPEDDLGWMQEFRNSQYLLPAREILFRQGETPHTLYTLFDGWLIIFKILDNGKRQILRFLLPGDFFGFQVNSIGPTGGYLHSSLALMDSTLCAFPTTQLRLMMEKQPQLAIRLAEMEMHDMNLCQHHLIGTGRKNAQERIAFLLLELFHRVRLQKQNDYDESSNSIIFPLTQEDIGDAVGLTSAHVNRTLREMEKKGWTQCQGKYLTIRNEEALSKTGQFDPRIIISKPLI